MSSIEEINRAIAERAGGSWVAADSPTWRVMGRPSTVPSHLFGLRLSKGDAALTAASADAFSGLGTPTPPLVDWRAEGRVTPIKDQGVDCGSCVAFAVCAAMESAHWIQAGAPLDLSEGHLFHCNGGSCDEGWDFGPALEAARAGVGLSDDLPYDPKSGCIKIGPAVRLVTYRVHRSIESRKRALLGGPVVGGMAVFEDFGAYSSGVYRHVIGTNSEHHAICVVGYSDSEQCWICKNSWGVGFGEAGYFRIGYGECELDSAIPFYSLEVTSVAK